MYFIKLSIFLPCILVLFLSSSLSSLPLSLLSWNWFICNCFWQWILLPCKCWSHICVVIILAADILAPNGDGVINRHFDDDEIRHHFTNFSTGINHFQCVACAMTFFQVTWCHLTIYCTTLWVKPQPVRLDGLVPEVIVPLASNPYNYTAPPCHWLRILNQTNTAGN